MPFPSKRHLLHSWWAEIKMVVVGPVVSLASAWMHLNSYNRARLIVLESNLVNYKSKCEVLRHTFGYTATVL